MLSTELRILIRDTGRVWWRLLPLILGVYLLGWLGNELTLRIAVILGDISPVVGAPSVRVQLRLHADRVNRDLDCGWPRAWH